MNERLQQLATRIRSEVVELERIVQRITEGWQRVRRSGDDYYLDGVALNLHGFYSGLERIFELVAATIDGSRPQGENWHQALLQQMCREMPQLRPAVISPGTVERLSEYRGFRHVVRNVYTFHFDASKVQRLVEQAPEVFAAAREELLAFAEFLEQNA
ncbi:MAG: hypothetical protein AB1894_29200 [Chloroflexota bacterium]